jgi:hypothetical protein
MLVVVAMPRVATPQEHSDDGHEQPGPMWHEEERRLQRPVHESYHQDHAHDRHNHAADWHAAVPPRWDRSSIAPEPWEIRGESVQIRPGLGRHGAIHSLLEFGVVQAPVAVVLGEQIR